MATGTASDCDKLNEDQVMETVQELGRESIAQHDMTEGCKANSTTNFAIFHKSGDLFSCPESDSLVHCVSLDLRMGKGIATLFKQKFGGLPELKLQANKVGSVAVLKRGPRFVYYLITKPKYFNKPTYDTLELSLYAMKDHCIQHGVTRVSMPQIGCGLDKLEWTRVEGKLIKIFQDTDIVLTVYTYR